MKRIKIVMDEKREIQPDGCKNYFVGEWDRDIEHAVHKAMKYSREILVFRPEGLALKVMQI